MRSQTSLPKLDVGDGDVDNDGEGNEDDGGT